MAATVALDETFWADPYSVRELQGIHTNSVHLYFYRSSFFDATSNNNVLLQQAFRFPEKAHLLQSRAAFEDAVRSMPSGGLEFMVVAEPESSEGAWVVQKQLRVPGHGAAADEIEVLATYWVGGDRIFMAPSVADTLASRILDTTTALATTLEAASALMSFAPSSGHTYFPSDAAPSKLRGFTQSQSRSVSPGAASVDASQAVGLSAPRAGRHDSAVGGAAFSEGFLLRSLKLATLYGNEYADENPLQGEPGSFKFTSTNERVAAQNAAALAAQEAQAAKSQTAPSFLNASHTANKAPAVTGTGGEPASRANTGSPTPKPTGDGAGSRKGSAARGVKDKKERRKSKAPTSPATPL